MQNQNQNQELIVRFTCVLSSILKKWRLVIIVAIICGISLDVFRTLTYRPMYASSVTATLNSENNTYQELQGIPDYITTLQYVFNGQVVENYVKEQTGIEDLDMTCSISSQNNTNIITIQVVSGARRNAYYTLDHLISWYHENASRYHLTYSLDTLAQPSIASSPINSNSHRSNFAQGAIPSVIVVIVLIGLASYMRRTIKTPKDIERYIDCRLFVKIPKERKPRLKRFWRKNKEAILISSLKTSFKYKEAIKKLRNRLESSAKKHGYKTIMITSCMENEGKSSVAANLALALAENHHSVLLIDADLRKPSVNKIFHLQTKRCVNQYLEDSENWIAQVQYVKKDDLFVMCAKQDLDQAEDYVHGQNMAKLIEEVSAQFEYVIVDTAPIVGTNDALAMTELVDASLLVVRQNTATEYTINTVINKLVATKNNLIGCVYNGSVADLTRTNRMYGYRYGYNQYRRRETR